jgi:hypothetical protein
MSGFLIFGGLALGGGLIYYFLSKAVGWKGFAGVLAVNCVVVAMSWFSAQGKTGFDGIAAAIGFMMLGTVGIGGLFGGLLGLWRRKK